MESNSYLQVASLTVTIRQFLAFHGGPEPDKLLEQLGEPHRTMVLVAACLGLRASEIMGLQGGLQLGGFHGPHSARSRERQGWRYED